MRRLPSNLARESTARAPTRYVRLVVFVGLAMMCVDRLSIAQNPDITRRPPLLNSAGRFSAIRLRRPPVIDGRAWIAIETQPTSDAGVVPLRIKAFSLATEDCGDHDGDFQRCHLLFQRGRAAPVRIDVGYTGWVFVTPDARYIIQEPLYVLDVHAWKQYALFEALQIPNYTDIEAISRDGKRLFISRSDCAMDCKDVRREYYQLTLP
jgi:hypothetical protein